MTARPVQSKKLQSDSITERKVLKYYCTSCGEIFDEPETYSECVGEFWGAPAYQDFAECPYCGGAFEETESCGYCLEDRNPETMIYFPASSFDKICPDCFGKYEAEYREAFLKRPTNDPERPGETYQDYFNEIKAVPAFKVKTFFDFIGEEEPANEAFFLFIKEQETRKAAARGKASNVVIHYKNRR